MNRRLITISTFAIVIAILQLNLSAQTWETTILYDDLPNSEGSGGLVADSLGNVFAGGNVSTGVNGSGPWQGIVLKTDTTGAHWDPSGDGTVSQSNPSQLNLGVDLAENLYSVGGRTPSSGAAQSWYVRKSVDHGVNWIEKDLYQYATGKSAAAVALVADPMGNIFALGYGRDKSGASHWVTRKSSNGGDTWSTVDDVKNATPLSLHATPNGALFAVGGTPWIVRRSLDAGQTWTTVDNPSSGWAHGVTSDNLGNIYVAGREHFTSGKPRNFVSYDLWTIRKSSNGGTSWSTTNSFSLAPNSYSCARAIGKDAAGNIVVVGYADDESSEYWTVRTLLSSGFWHTDTFQLSVNGFGDARSLTVDADGHLLVSGIAGDANGSHWIVRRLIP
jgi:hypothetical protein